MRTRNTGILLLGATFIKLSLGDQRLEEVLSVWYPSWMDKDLQCHISFCFLLQLHFARFLNSNSRL